MDWRGKLTTFLMGAALPTFIIALWEFTARERLVSPFLLPPFTSVAANLWDDISSGDIWVPAGETLVRLLISYFVSVFFGVMLGILMASLRVARWFLDPILSIGLPAPKIAFLPIFVLWFGVFDMPKIIMSIVACIFPIIAGTWAGAQSVDKYLVWSAENLGAKRHEVLVHVIFPAALPQVLTAMQVALPIAFIVVIVSEMLTSANGLGGSMIEGARLADSPRVFSNLIAIGVLGYTLLWTLQVVRRRILVWHPEVLQEKR